MGVSVAQTFAPEEFREVIIDYRKPVTVPSEAATEPSTRPIQVIRREDDNKLVVLVMGGVVVGAILVGIRKRG